MTNSVLMFDKKITNQNEFNKIMDILCYLEGVDDTDEDTLEILNNIHLVTEISAEFNSNLKTRSVNKYSIFLETPSYSKIILEQNEDVDEDLNSRTTLTNYVNKINEKYQQWLNMFIGSKQDDSDMMLG